MKNLNLKQHTEIPKNDIDAWNKHHRYNWVYDVPRILTMQHIEWTPFKTNINNTKLSIFNIDRHAVIERNPEKDQEDGFIYVKHLDENHLFTDVAIYKGEPKWIQNYKLEDGNYSITDTDGIIKLKTFAFIPLCFKRYSGMVNFESYGDVIVSIKLGINDDISMLYTDEINNKIIKIYNSKPWGK